MAKVASTDSPVAEERRALMIAAVAFIGRSYSAERSAAVQAQAAEDPDRDEAVEPEKSSRAGNLLADVS